MINGRDRRSQDETLHPLKKRKERVRVRRHNRYRER